MKPIFAKEVMMALREDNAKISLLIGGEPTLYPDLSEIVSFGSQINLKMVIINNGRRFKNRRFIE
ncbi:MAG: hypothetical protein M1505_02375 [Patescibacteria group bacterium]|nr:hypothetical protein [Patescibacteria group bacterium]